MVRSAAAPPRTPTSAASMTGGDRDPPFDDAPRAAAAKPGPAAT